MELIMASVHLYECKKCGFSAESEGASSRGMRYFCKCFKCNDCGYIGDNFTKRNISFADYSEVEWVDVEPACKECKSPNVIEWDFQCPKCSLDMIKSQYVIRRQD